MRLSFLILFVLLSRICIGQTSYTSLFLKPKFSLNNPPSIQQIKTPTTQFQTAPSPFTTKTPTVPQVAVPPGFAYEELGVFCKLEYNMGKGARLPVRFRLGEFHYTEGLEGKHSQ